MVADAIMRPRHQTASQHLMVSTNWSKVTILLQAFKVKSGKIFDM